MWESMLGRLPQNLVIVCTVLTFLVPYSVYKINQKLHKYGDPPWKKDDKKDGK
ncbi:hypothetical protein J2Z83_002572 [Virgibacillus natechei]|uniref:Uncharacterized protein n=1 Tax=Virgibacillus natechei TaxID=1216297 RepID=A0ABS4IJ35_9BACI|nr:hypothetical protein [Virgibacillus natechei]